MQITVKHIFRHNHQKALVKTLLWVALKYDHTKKKKYFFIANTIDSGFNLTLKWLF